MTNDGRRVKTAPVLFNLIRRSSVATTITPNRPKPLRATQRDGTANEARELLGALFPDPRDVIDIRTMIPDGAVGQTLMMNHVNFVKNVNQNVKIADLKNIISSLYTEE